MYKRIKVSKKDEQRLKTLRPIAARYNKCSYRAAEWYKRTGEAMCKPGALSVIMKESKAASAEIQTILAKYK